MSHTPNYSSLLLWCRGLVQCTIHAHTHTHLLCILRWSAAHYISNTAQLNIRISLSLYEYITRRIIWTDRVAAAADKHWAARQRTTSHINRKDNPLFTLRCWWPGLIEINYATHSNIFSTTLTHTHARRVRKLLLYTHKRG